jgi:hypothetical protein
MRDVLKTARLRRGDATLGIKFSALYRAALGQAGLSYLTY